MKFHQIRYFLAACDHMNFTHAAEACAVSQPALTVAIQQLETELGGPLFRRDGRALTLTALGQAMRTHLGRIDETRRAAASAAAEIVEGEMQYINLGVMCTIGPGLIGPAMGAWRTEAPVNGTGIELVLHDVRGDRAGDLLLSGAIDCALIGRRKALPERFETRALMVEPMELALAPGHPLAQRSEITLADLDGMAYADRLHCEFRDEFMDLLEEREMEVETVFHSEREDWIQQIVALGQAGAMLPVSSIISDGIVTRPVADMPVTRTIYLVTVRGRSLSNAAAGFVEFLGSYDWQNAGHSAA